MISGLRGAIAAIWGIGATLLPLTAQAQTDAGDNAPRLVFLAADPAEGLADPVVTGLSVLNLPGLPAAGDAGNQVLAAMLRASPVSTLVAQADQMQGQASDIYLVTDLTLSADPASPGGVMVRTGTQDMALADYVIRLEELIAALSPKTRQIGMFRINDPAGVVPAALDAISRALGQSGFALSIVTIGPDPAACDGPRVPHHYALLSGVPDRAPFGDGDGLASSAEVRAYMAGAIERGRRRTDQCAAEYGFLLLGDADPAVTLITVPARPLVPEIDSTVYMETFQAVFLEDSADAAEIGAFLADCRFCPGETRLSERLRDIAEREMVLGLERSIWESIVDDTTPQRISAYLANCRLCAYRPDAETRLADIAAVEAARVAESTARDTLSAARDLAGLRDWLATCLACDGRAEVEALVAGIEADTAYQAEQAALTAALDAQNAEGVQAWLDSCTLCDGRDRAVAALEMLTRSAAALAPCRAAAGLPQLGGPRMLTEIDAVAALAACQSVLTAFADNPEAVTLLGRISLSQGDRASALVAYDTGMAAAVPAAFGLAAHEHYAPSDGQPEDFVGAETLALQGATRGDWLSAEVLTVLYSNELIPGKNAIDAYAVAEANAAQGNPVAQFFIGYFHQTGLGAERDLVKAAAAFQIAVDAGYLHANSFLAEIYETGDPAVPQDTLRASDLYWAALQAGDPTAVDRLTTQIAIRNPDVVRDIQGRLRDAGVFTGRIDGIAGPNTIEAVRALVLDEVVVE